VHKHEKVEYKYYNAKTLNTTTNLYACFRSSAALNGSLLLWCRLLTQLQSTGK
jgi:hypothetical protein